MDQGLSEALENAIEGQMKRGETTFIEVVLNQELGEPFRRDAMKKPVGGRHQPRRHAPAMQSEPLASRFEIAGKATLAVAFLTCRRTPRSYRR
jgi:hypothetical protein